MPAQPRAIEPSSSAIVFSHEQMNTRRSEARRLVSVIPSNLQASPSACDDAKSGLALPYRAPLLLSGSNLAPEECHEC
ncbi:hypothetical protein RHIZ404_200637 [Rhizobium sp. EC-SD404]|nr:hypothetical protein RHIZ404_200637 [Rhizobium sp. EC-SD404]